MPIEILKSCFPLYERVALKKQLEPRISLPDMFECFQGKKQLIKKITT